MRRVVLRTDSESGWLMRSRSVQDMKMSSEKWWWCKLLPRQEPLSSLVYPL